MKKRIHIPFLIMVFCTYVPLFAVAADPAQPILPLEPKDLITYMPPPPKGWQLLASVAANSFMNGWVAAYATRELKQIPPPPPPGAEETPLPPVTMTVHLTDSGFKPDFTFVVTAPKTGAPANTTYIQVQGCPARLIHIDDKTALLDFLIASRFLVEIRSVNLPEDQLKSVAETLDVTKLSSVPPTGQSHLSDPVVLSRVDELNPQNNGSHAVYWSAQ